MARLNLDTFMSICAPMAAAEVVKLVVQASFVPNDPWTHRQLYLFTLELEHLQAEQLLIHFHSPE